MKKFIRKMQSLVIIGFAISASISFINYSSINFFIPKLKSSSIIMGDSHAACSFNTRDYFANKQNIAQSNETLPITFYKLKYLIKGNHIDTVLLSLSHHNLSEWNEYKIYKSKYLTHQLLERNYSILFSGGRSLMNSTFPIEYLIYPVFKKVSVFPRIVHDNFIGDFNGLNGNNITKSLNSANEHFYENNREYNISNLQINYLDSIVNLCEVEKIQLILFGTPVHPKYFDLIPNEFKITYNNLLEEHEGLILLNYVNSFHDETFYYDYDHLNIKGANQFAKMLTSHLLLLHHSRKDEVAKE